MKPRSTVSTRALVWLSASAMTACAGVPYVYAAAPITVHAEMQDSSGFGTLDPTPPIGLTAQEIVAKMAGRESAFNQARQNYTFRQSVKVDTVAEDSNKVDGEYQQITDITFNAAGKREEHVVFAPQNTLERVMMSPADFEDIEHRLPFVLTKEDAAQYDVTYIGKQKIDDVDTYAFDVKPKVMEKGKRYFQGRIWVDQKDLQIVVTNGKNVPDDMRKGHEDLSPPFTTYRAQVDGKYWFPVYTKGDGVLHFPAGKGYLSNDVHIREIVKYSDYKRFGSSVRITTVNGSEVERDDSAPAQPTTPH